MGEKILKILKQAYWLVRGQKTLWLAGLFLVWPNLFIGSMILFALVNTIGPVGSEGGIPYTAPQSVEGDPVVGVISMAVIGILLVLYFRFRSYVALAVRQILSGKNLDAKKVWLETRHQAWPLFSLLMSFLSGLIIFFTLISIPITNLVAQGHTDRAVGLGIVAAGLFIPVLAVVYLVMILSPLFHIVYKLGLWDSVRISFDITRRLWRRLLLFTASLAVVQLVGLIISAALAVLASAPFVLLIKVFYDMDKPNGMDLMQGLAGIVGFMVFFMSQAAFSAYSKTAWSVLFFEIIKPAKVEKDSDETVVPESVPTKITD